MKTLYTINNPTDYCAYCPPNATTTGPAIQPKPESVVSFAKRQVKGQIFENKFNGSKLAKNIHERFFNKNKDEDEMYKSKKSKKKPEWNDDKYVDKNVYTASMRPDYSKPGFGSMAVRESNYY